MNISNILDLNDHINTKPIPKPENQSHMNYSSMEPVLFEKHHNIKLLSSVSRVTTFFQFDSTEAALSILLQYMDDLDKNLKTLCSKLVTNYNVDVDVGFSFCLVLLLKVNFVQFLTNRILFINKHKLSPVQVTWLPWVSNKMLYFANKHPGVLVFVCLIKIYAQLILG